MSETESRGNEGDDRYQDAFGNEDIQRKTIYIVDDDPAARLALAAIIAPLECRVVFGSDAADARDRLCRINPDVIICDLVMQKMCGDEFFRWLQGHERWRLVPVIGVTRFNEHVVKAELLRAGADSILVKPCNASELRAQVQAALRTRRKYVELAGRWARTNGHPPSHAHQADAAAVPENVPK